MIPRACILQLSGANPDQKGEAMATAAKDRCKNLNSTSAKK